MTEVSDRLGGKINAKKNLPTQETKKDEETRVQGKNGNKGGKKCFKKKKS